MYNSFNFKTHGFSREIIHRKALHSQGKVFFSRQDLYEDDRVSFLWRDLVNLRVCLPSFPSLSIQPYPIITKATVHCYRQPSYQPIIQVIYVHFVYSLVPHGYFISVFLHYVFFPSFLSISALSIGTSTSPLHTTFPALSFLLSDVHILD